jgi:MoaA/NifB/PqqE/SkfB family radical SAM enzyme|tara:strand:+ start:426 stop:1289 length:864 start_codon:yes stop_codon:yes gene_type:complete
LFSPNSARVLHLESTTVCQASCPQCAREDSNLFAGQVAHLSVKNLQALFTESQITSLDKVFMCGNFGDPAAGANTTEIYKWFRTINPTITLGMNTNGALQNTTWWKQIAELFNQPEDYVVFSIDGLQDTNHIYRRGVVWDKLIENVEAFIGNGGNAIWDYIIFEHNQHQVEQAKQLAKQLGFNWFSTKVSKRGKLLEPHTGIDCHALKESSLYVSATGELLPCCFLANNVFTRDSKIDKALDTENFKGVIDSWDKDPLGPCSRICGVRDSATPFEKQWTTHTRIEKG